MGAMTIPMYLINRRLQDKPVYLANCISIAPTGKNSNVADVSTCANARAERLLDRAAAATESGQVAVIAMLSV